MTSDAPPVCIANAEDRDSLLRAVEILNEVPTSKWDIGVLTALHRRLLSPTHPYRGQVRTHAGVVRLNGKIQRELPPSSECMRMADIALRRLGAILGDNSAVNWPAIAAETMRRLIEAHPFKDGNGRVSRAVATWLLMQGGYELISNPRVYCRQHADEYYRALGEAMGGKSLAVGEERQDKCDLWNQFFGEMVRACFKAPTSCRILA